MRPYCNYLHQTNRPVTLNFKYSQRQAPGKDSTVRKSKKVKPKNQPNTIGKQRPIKFHEYKVNYFLKVK